MIKHYLLIIFGRVTFFILTLINIFIKVKFINLYSSRIGHLVWNFENFYQNCYISNKNQKIIYIFLLDQTIANKKVFEVLRKKINAIFIKNKISHVLRALLEVESNSKFILPFHLIHPPRPILRSRILQKSDIDKISRNKILGLENDSYVVFNSRDELYLQTSKTNYDKNVHDYRNFNFTDYESAFSFLNTHEIISIRIGSVNEKYSGFYGLKDLSNSEFDNELTLISNSRFFVSGNSGIAQLSTIIQKPQLYVNYIPLRLDHLASMAPKSILIPKLIYSENNTPLSLIKIFHLFENWSIHDPNFFHNNNIKFQNNTPLEIRDGVIDMNEKYEFNKNLENHADISFYKKLCASSFDKELAWYVFFELEIRFSNRFLKNHGYLREI